MRDSVPSPRYSTICNVLRQWKTSLIPTYKVSDYDIIYIHVYLYIIYIYIYQNSNIYQNSCNRLAWLAKNTILRIRKNTISSCFFSCGSTTGDRVQVTIIMR